MRRALHPLASALAALLLTACTAGPFGPTGAAGKLNPFRRADAEGFTPLHDGKTLKGWRSQGPTQDMSYWSVQDGAITGSITPEHPLAVNQYLVWQGGKLADFELKMEFRLTGTPNVNGGFQFRSLLLPDGDVAGYQVDNNLDTDWLVRLYDEHGRHDLALRGEAATYGLDGKRDVVPIPGVAGKPAHFKLNEWHEYHLIAKGTHLELWVNGVKVAVVDDNDPVQNDASGILGLQLHSGPPMKAQFRNVRVKKL